jgi:steroid delta-isomerase-like uncharacterized protein
MSAEMNMALIYRFHEVSEGGNEAGLRAIVTPSFQLYGPGAPTPMNIEQGIQMGRMFIDAFPDGRSTIEEMVAQDNLVATRGLYRGTHRGDFMGMPATGKEVEVPWISFDRIVDGKLAEHRFLMDIQVMMQQLGAVPA